MLDLGNPYISDFLRPGEDGDRAPLLMARCESCTLVQTRHTVNPERLFRHYWYQSGVNETMVAALRDVVEDACSKVNLERNDAVMDIGANDGTLLRQYPVDAFKIAVEPARGFRDQLTSAADLVYSDFFPMERLPGLQPKVITSIACFYAVDEPHAFVAAIKKLLHPEGVWMVQLQDLASVLRDRAFDYFCHEHLALYSLHSFERLIHEHGLEIVDWSTNDTNGGSLRITVMHGNRLTTSVRPEDEGQQWVEFATAIQNLRADTVSLLTRLKSLGKRVGGLAASTKANTLLQFYGIGPELLPWIADRSAFKHGLRTVGSGIPIVSEEWARDQHPDYYLALAWHFLDSFQRREAAFLNRGGVIIAPLPELALHSRMSAAA